MEKVFGLKSNREFELRDMDGVPMYGFDFNETFITDPTISECGRFSVTPDHYGLTQAEADDLVLLNGQDVSPEDWSDGDDDEDLSPSGPVG